MKTFYFIAFIFILTIRCTFAQVDTAGYTVKTEVINGDTLPMMILDEVIVSVSGIETPSGKAGVKYSKLVRDVKKVYPYAVIAAAKYEEYGKLLTKVSDKDEQKKLMKKAEEELKVQFEEDVKKMTMTQGKILLKLIYRQTNNTSYELVKEFRGSFRAVFWQSIGKIFGMNLKVKYDPEGEDKYIEDIVKKIENGTL
jgi:hypothetical protein